MQLEERGLRLIDFVRIIVLISKNMAMTEPPSVAEKIVFYYS